jgi:hypothetical protein
MRSRSSDGKFGCFLGTLLLAALVFFGLAILAAEVRGDNRPMFELEFGECDEALFQFGRGALASYLCLPVWDDFDEHDAHLTLVCEAWQLFDVHEADSRLCVLLTAPNPGWRGRRGDRAKVAWEPDRWLREHKSAFKIVQLRTRAR